MRDWRGITAGALLAVIAFQIGYLSGAKDCPANTLAETERKRAVDRDVAAAFSAPTARDAICDKVFDLIEGGLSQEALDDQAERVRSPALADQ